MEPVQTAPPSPFNPAAVPATRGRGCSKPMVVGCLGIFLGGGILVLAGLIYVATHLPTILRHSFATMEQELTSVMPPTVTAPERDRLHRAFASAMRAMEQATRTESPDPKQRTRVQSEMFRVQSELFNVSRKGSGMTRDDVLRLTEALERLGGTTPDAAPPPAPVPPPPAAAPEPVSSSPSSGPRA